MDLGGGIKCKEENRAAINSFGVGPDVEQADVPHTHTHTGQ